MRELEHPAPPTDPLRSFQQAPWRRLFGYLQPYRWKMALAIVGLLIASSISLAFPLIIGETVGQVLAAANYQLLNQFVLLLLVLFAIQGVGEFLQNYMLSVIGERVVYQLRTTLYRHLTELSLDFFGQRRTGELLSRLNSDVTLIRNLLTINITSLLSSVVMLIGSVIIVFTLNPSLTFFLLLLVPVIVAIATFLGRRLEKLSTRVQDSVAAASVTAEEGISGIRVVKSFAREHFEQQRFANALQQTVNIALQAARLNAAFSGLMVFLGFGAIAGIVWFAGRQVIGGSMTITLLTSFLIYGVQIAFGFGQLAGLYTEARQALGAVQRVFDLLDTQSSVDDQADAKPIEVITGQIELQQVWFRYGSDPANAPTVLRDINLTIAPGEIIALVGPSGAGKSTLFNLIPRFYDPTAGVVRIDGHNVRDLTMASLRQQIGLVPQGTMLFGGTIRENIRYGRLAASDAEVEAAAQAAHAHQFILELPQGYDTLVGERGTRLSGGQRQRVAIARAILKDPRILLLDEATSALDNESERLVQAALDRLMQGRTTVIIAHRLSTITAADRIVVMDRGQIVEVGTHQQLLEADGLYARLHAMQFREFDLEVRA